jgi:hypothetical protein
METYEGVGPRIRARLVVLGYAKPDGELDVQRFCFDHRFDKTNVYNWLRDSYTPLKDLTRLCDALDCSERWLLLGAERKRRTKKSLAPAAPGHRAKPLARARGRHRRRAVA